MKKLLVTGIALLAVLMFALPATATTVELGGYYRVEGRYIANPTLDEDNEDPDVHWRHRFRLTPAFIVSDALRFDFKMDIFDGTKWGSEGGQTAKNTDAIDFDRLWMTISAPFGKFALGRMAGGAWGLTFGNDNEDYDRARFDTKFGNVSTGIILQKNFDFDYNNPGSDQDLDVYYLYGVYRADFGAIGLLGAYVNNKTNPDVDGYAYNLLPYFDVKFGGLGLRGELKWATGENDPDAAAAATTDTEELAYTLQADYTFGAFTVGGGYAFVQGEDDDPTDQTVSNKGFGGLGDDWDLFIVATDVDQVINTNGFGILDTGVEMFYVDAEWKANKAWTFTARAGMFQADEVGPGVDDEIGWEFDLDASWNVMKNLKWRFTGGYFDADDYFESQGITNVDSTYTLRHQLTLSF